MEEKGLAQWEKFYKLSIKILIFVLVIIFLPLILFILALLFIWKYGILNNIVKFFKPKIIRICNFQESFYTTDRFWEKSKGSIGVVVILNGNVDLQAIRDEFTKNVLQATCSLTEEKVYGKLTQIPISFGGYYFWQKANYFLIHEHIREIDTLTNEAQLKKFISTLLKLPFPNKRPLWEIVVSKYNTNCSTLILRVHQSVTDSNGLISILCSLTNGKLKNSIAPRPTEMMTNMTSQAEPEFSCIGRTRKVWRNTQSIYEFIFSLFKPRNLTNSSESDIVSWNETHEIPYGKIMISQNVLFQSIVLSTIKGMMLSEDCNSIADTSGRKLQSLVKDDFSVLVPVPTSKNSFDNVHGFVLVKTIHKDETDMDSIKRLQEINQSIKNATVNKHPQAWQTTLKLLSLIPKKLEKFIISKWFHGGSFIYQEYISEIISSFEKIGSNPDESLDLISILDHEILSVIPLCGLTWRSTAVSISVSKFQRKIITTLTIDSSFLDTINPQDKVDNLCQSLPNEIDKIFEDSKDDQGFINIPII